MWGCKLHGIGLRVPRRSGPTILVALVPVPGSGQAEIRVA